MESILLRQARILDQIADVVIATDLRGRVVSWNKAAERFFGVPARNALGRSSASLYPKRLLRFRGEKILKPLRAKGKHQVEFWLPRRGGGQACLEMSAFFVRDEEGKPMGIVGVSRDVTEKKAAGGILAISEREQRRLGHDLHDELGPQLVGMEMLGRVLARDLAKISRPAEKRAAELADMARAAARHIRDLARGLAPLLLESHGLAFALGDLAERTRKVFGVGCSFVAGSCLPAMDAETSVHLYRIAQEAVGNALKHGRPTQITVELQSGRRWIELRISDNGRGWSPGRVRGKGMGLRIMRYRAELAGGTLAVASRPGRGTSISCVLKLPSHAMTKRVRQ